MHSVVLLMCFLGVVHKRFTIMLRVGDYFLARHIMFTRTHEMNVHLMHDVQGFHVGVNVDSPSFVYIVQIVECGRKIGQTAFHRGRFVFGMHRVHLRLGDIMHIDLQTRGGICTQIGRPSTRDIVIDVQEEDAIGCKLCFVQRGGVSRGAWVARQHPPLRLAIELRQASFNQLGQDRVGKRRAFGQVLANDTGGGRSRRDGLLQHVLRVHRHKLVLLGQHVGDILIVRPSWSSNHHARQPRSRRLLARCEHRPHTLHLISGCLGGVHGNDCFVVRCQESFARQVPLFVAVGQGAGRRRRDGFTNVGGFLRRWVEDRVVHAS
eukprot:m.50440 g.50440  ORF g.50440 m.50440 type:complete len:321 (+) comp7238_c0_seq2:1170-2132(+)